MKELEWKETERKLRTEHLQELHIIRSQLQRRLDAVLIDKDQIEMVYFLLLP